MTTHLEELIKLDSPVLIDVHLLDHVPDLVAGDVLAQGLENVADFGGGDVTVAVRIELERDGRRTTIVNTFDKQEKGSMLYDNVNVNCQRARTKLSLLRRY